MKTNHKDKIEEKTTENKGTNKKQVFRVFIIITILSFVTLLIMKLIAPNSRALPTFLIGFGFIFVVIVLVALYFNYTSNIYKEIRNGKPKSNSNSN